MAKNVCKCRMDMLAATIILAAIGIACLVNGFTTQFNEADMVAWWKFGLAYIVGLVFLMLAKMTKWKTVESCPVHKKV